MIEELKTLLDAVASIPTLAVWVAIGFLFYKVFIWGSVVAALLKSWSLLIEWMGRWVDAKPRLADTELEKLKVSKMPEVKQLYVGKVTITGEEGYLLQQIKRCAGKGIGINSQYLHQQSIDWLRDAIDEKELREQEVKSETNHESSRAQ